MPVTPRKHSQADCAGTFVRVYQRAGRESGFQALGYVCTGCRELLFDEDLSYMHTLNELRPAIERTANELAGLLADRAVQDKLSAIVRTNPTLLSRAQSGNHYLAAQRRWYAVSTALGLRRHIESGTPNTLRFTIERLVELERSGQTDDVAAGGGFSSDLAQLEQLSARFRPYLSAIIQGASTNASLTFDDLSHALDTACDIGERAYAAICNVSRRLEPTIMDDWAEIFRIPWIQGCSYAYELGAAGVPFDAIALTEEEAAGVAKLDLTFEPRGSIERAGVTVAKIRNTGEHNAIDLRLFVPHMRTVIQTPILRGHGEASSDMHWRDSDDPKFGYGQAVLEFEDGSGRIFRQYADVDVRGAISRNLTQRFRVAGRIVAAQQFQAAVGHT